MRIAAERLVLVGALVLAAVRPAAADDNIAKADALFAEGVKLRDSDVELACAKFGESLELNPQAIGTLLNVAVCDEKQGRIATAVRRFREARQRAAEDKLAEHLKLANEKIAALSPDVPHVKIRFLAPPPHAEPTVIFDGRLITPGTSDDVAADPGERVLVVSAPGYVSFQKTILITKGARTTIDVPALAKAVSSSRRTVGKLAVLSGGALTVTGVTLGYFASRRYRRQFDSDECRYVGGDPSCSPDGHSAIKSARTLGNVGTVIGGVGLAAAITGGILWYFAPARPTSERSVRIVPQVAPDASGVAVVGRF